jgi:DNA-binding transcriptional LysR family regulator
MDVTALTTFADVAETGSFTAAARRRGLSKAAASRQVAALERELGVLLLARTTRRLTLTDAGRRVLARARRIQDELDALTDEAGEGLTAARGRVRMSAPLAWAQRVLAPALPEFLRAWPDIELELSLSDRATDLIADGFDLGLRIGTMPDSSLRVRTIAPVRLMLVAAPAYWLARGKPVRPEDLSLHACIRYANTEANSIWSFAASDGSLVRVPVRGPMCVDNGEVDLPVLRAGLGCAILPDFLVDDDVAAGVLETGLCDWSPGERTLHLLFPPGAGRPRRVQVLADWLVDRFGPTTPPR